MKMLPVIYLASPYSYYTKIPLLARIVRWWRKREVTRIAALLTEKEQVALVLPITQSGEMSKFLKDKNSGFVRWSMIDLSFIAKSNGVWIVTMPGWDTSIGVTAEIEFARKQGLPVLYIDPLTLKKTSKPARVK